jgi:hypothetical protein
MELDELKQAWHAMEQRLDRQQALNTQLLAESRIDRAKRHLRWLLLGQCAQLALGLLVTVLSARFWIANHEVPPMLAAGLAGHAWGVLLICSAVVELLLVTRIQYAQPVITVQRYLALLRRWRTRVAPWLGLPFLLACMFGPMALAALGAPVSTGWLVGNLVVCLGLVLAAAGFYRWSHRPGREALAGRIDDFLGGDSLRRAREQLDELAAFERE